MDGGCCKVRVLCRREIRQAAMQLILLCLACCSWTLLLISLTLTTSSTTHRHVIEVVEVPDPGWQGGSDGACEECLTRRGPPGTYWKVFRQPLQQVVSALNQLDQPLAAPALRTHLLGAQTILRHLVNVLHLPLTVTTSEERDIKESEAVILPAPGKPHDRLACQERFLGSKTGYPRYLTGFMRDNCTAAPLHQAVTAVLWDVKSEHLAGILSDFQRVYPDLSLIILTGAAISPTSPTHVIRHPTPSITNALADLLKEITTPYVLLAPRLAHLSRHSRLERLIWAAEWTGVWVVSGSVRGEDGRWRAGCLQVMEGEGQLVYSRGYHTSLYECQLCQSVEGPVMIRTEALKSLQFPTLINPHLLLPHILLQIHTKSAAYQHGAVTCPDTMFLVTDVEPPWQQRPTPPLLQERELRRVAALWRPIARRRNLARIHLPSSITINYPCDFLDTARPHIVTKFSPTATDGNTTAVRACEGKELQAMLSAILQACDKSGYMCYLLEPTLSDVVGGDLFDLVGRNITLGINSTNIPSRLLTTSTLHHYKTVNEDGRVRMEGRWWVVSVVLAVPDHHTRWSRYATFIKHRVEVIPGVWLWGQLLSYSEKQVTGGEARLLTDLHALEISLEEDMRSLAAPRCAQGRSTHLTLRSP